MNKYICLALSIFFCLVLAAPNAYSCSPKFGGPGAPPPNCCECDPNCMGSPNYVMTGAYKYSTTDLQLPTRGYPLLVQRTYLATRAVDGIFGFGQTSNLTTRIVETKNPSTGANEAIVVMPDGRPVRFAEQPDGSFVPPIESHDSLVRNPDGSYDFTLKLSRSKYHFNAFGALQTMTDDYGNSIVFNYDGNGRLTSVTDGTGSGRSLTLNYGPSGRVGSISDSAGRSVVYTYDGQGVMTTVTDAEGRQATFGHVSGRYGQMLSTITDHWGRNVTTVTYDADGRTNTYTEAGETYTYSYLNDPTNPQYAPYKTKKITASSGFARTFTWEPALGQITQVLDSATNKLTTYYPDGSIKDITENATVFAQQPIVTKYTYNANGSVATLERNIGVKYFYSYDDTNYPEKVTRIVPGAPPNWVITRDWQEWQYDYHPPGSAAPGALHHVIAIKSDGSPQTIATYTYNSAGQVLTVTDAIGAVTSYAYDPTTGDLLSVTYPKNSDSGPTPVYTYTRDAAGRVGTTTNPLGEVTSYTYDDLDRILTVTMPKPSPASPDFITGYAYDNYDAGTGLLFTHQTDPNGSISRQGYDQYGQLRESRDSQQNATTFAYANGHLTSITDANGNVTAYGYNSAGQLTSTTFPGGAVESYTYGNYGLLRSKTDRNGQSTYFAYDVLKRLIAKCNESFECPTGNLAIRYVYTGQNLTTIQDRYFETHTLTYDTMYRLASSQQGARGTVSYTYDAAGRMLTNTIAGGPTATYTYYDDGSLRTIDWSPVPGPFQYTYTLNGQYNTVGFPNGQSRTYNYDDQGRLTGLVNTHPVTGNLGTFAYGYDIDHATGQSTRLGQRTSMTYDGNLTKYYYDPVYQLQQVDYPNVTPFNNEVNNWTYDPIGNRLTHTVNGTPQSYSYYQVNGHNSQRLQSDGTATFTYSNNGTLTSDGTYTYTWYKDDMLASITGAGLSAVYNYDPQGRRYRKTINSVVTDYLYDGQNLVKETTGSASIYYLFGPGIDEPLAQQQGAQVYYYNVDGLGSVISINDAPGAVVKSYTFDAWGAQRASSGSLANPFTYTARESAEAGLMYYRARYYNPTIGRFISEDRAQGASRPSLGIAAALHAYTYVENDPMNWIDPSGRIKKRPVVRYEDCFDPADVLECVVECKMIGKELERCQKVFIWKNVIKDGKVTRDWWERDEPDCQCKDDLCDKNPEVCKVLESIGQIIAIGFLCPAGGPGLAPAR